jgi:hypothetical protein
VAPDPYQWKGTDRTLRGFNRGATHNEIGLQSVETTGYGVDGDFDGVVDELTVGDLTALTVYLAAQPRPTTNVELSALRDAFEAAGEGAEADLLELPAVTVDEIAAIDRGEGVFDAIDCSSCHVKSLDIDNPIFAEPSANPNYRDTVFPVGLDPVAEGVDPASPVFFDLGADQPDNKFVIDGVLHDLGSFESNGNGGVTVRLFGDLKRHNMGNGLAESIDEAGTGKSRWMTKELWGVGATDPYLHDGRATTLSEAILEHGGEASSHSAAFDGLPAGDQADLIAFLSNLTIYLPGE